MDTSSIVHIYIDEFSTPDLEVGKAGNEQFFVYAAVIIRETDLSAARKTLSGVISKYYSASRYIKSSKIPKDEKGYVLTLNTLTELRTLPHSVCALVVDKSEISRDSGLSYKRSFIKFFNKLLTQHFVGQYDEFHIIADKTGNQDFQASLKLYLEQNANLGKTLFSNNTFEVSDDVTGERLIQLADFYAGTIGRYYCGKYDQNRAEVINNTLRSKLSVLWYPDDYVSLIASGSQFDSSFDLELMKIAIGTAEKYVASNSDDTIGREIIQYILQESVRNPKRPISSKEIKANLFSRGVEIGDPITKISELRGKGVLIISPIGKKGYKLPTSEEELADFYNRLSSNVIPQLIRGNTLNDVLNETTVGKYNILGHSEFQLLSELCHKVKDFNHLSSI